MIERYRRQRMMEETLMERLRRMADRLTSERPSDRVLNFTLDDQKYWIKRKLGNGRNQLVKYSAEKEFYYEIARMTIAGRNNPDLVPEIEVLTRNYMVTKDGSTRTSPKQRRNSSWKRLVQRSLPSTRTASSMAVRLSATSHGTTESSISLTGKTACTPRTRLRRKHSISFSFFRESTAKTIPKPAKERTPSHGATSKTAAKRRERKRAVS